MFNSRFNNLLTIILIVSIIAIIALLGYFGYSVFNKYSIESGAKDIIEEFKENVGNNKPNDNVENQNVLDENIVIGEGIPESNTIYSQTSSSTTTYYGYDVIGTISIPKIKIDYPILAKATSRALNVAVGYLEGADVNDEGNTVIQGHNLRNGQFFSNLNKLSIGDKIYILDDEGKQVEYEVYDNFQAEATDTSFYRRDTQGKSEITLSTCYPNNNDLRTIILAREV